MGADSVTIFETIGLVGGIFHILGMFPQMYHMYQTQNFSGLNLQFFSICILGSLCELVYLIHMDAWPSWVPATIMVFCPYFGSFTRADILYQTQISLMIITMLTAIIMKHLQRNALPSNQKIQATIVFQDAQFIFNSTNVEGSMDGIKTSKGFQTGADSTTIDV